MFTKKVINLFLILLIIFFIIYFILVFLIFNNKENEYFITYYELFIIIGYSFLTFIIYMILNHTMSLKLFLQTIFLYLFFLLILNLSFNINEIHNNDMIRANLLGIFLNYIYFSIIIYLFFSYPKKVKKK